MATCGLTSPSFYWTNYGYVQLSEKVNWGEVSKYESSKYEVSFLGKSDPCSNKNAQIPCTVRPKIISHHAGLQYVESTKTNIEIFITMVNTTSNFNSFMAMLLLFI